MNITTIALTILLIVAAIQSPVTTEAPETDAQTCNAPCEYDAERDSVFCPCG